MNLAADIPENADILTRLRHRYSDIEKRKEGQDEYSVKYWAGLQLDIQRAAEEINNLRKEMGR